MKKKVSKKFVEMTKKMESQGDYSYLDDLNLEQFVDYLIKRFDDIPFQKLNK